MKLQTINNKKKLIVDDHPASPGSIVEYDEEKINNFRIELEGTIANLEYLKTKRPEREDDKELLKRFKNQLKKLNNLIK